MRGQILDQSCVLTWSAVTEDAFRTLVTLGVYLMADINGRTLKIHDINK